jgi:hypothetical protein
MIKIHRLGDGISAYPPLDLLQICRQEFDDCGPEPRSNGLHLTSHVFKAKIIDLLNGGMECCEMPSVTFVGQILYGLYMTGVYEIEGPSQHRLVHSGVISQSR